MSDSRLVLEVIACGVADAIEAEKGGADRLEVISHFECGGLTPPLELVQAMQGAVRLPLRIMLRESASYQTRSEDEIERLCRAAHQFAALGVDGVVLGFLRAGEIDLEITQRILNSAPGLRATFHHAFDEVRDKSQALADLSSCKQIDRVLTSGGPGELKLKIERLAHYQQLITGKLKILVGGGVDAAVIKAIHASTGLTEFHIGRAARIPPTISGEVRAARVKAHRCA
jgi:copper homeostasis protein